VATLHEYFLKDFSNALTADFNWQTVSVPAQDISVKVGFEVNSSAHFVAYYVPEHEHYLQIFENLINAWPDAIKQAKGVEIISGFVGDVHVGLVGSSHSIFTNRVYIYTKTQSMMRIFKR
jgi:hypothetical protein